MSQVGAGRADAAAYGQRDGWLPAVAKGELSASDGLERHATAAANAAANTLSFTTMVMPVEPNQIRVYVGFWEILEIRAKRENTGKNT